VGPLNLAFWIGGILLIALGYTRARRPWLRYRELKEQDENVARYEAWRGGTRSERKTGASVTMEILRRQAQREALIAILGFVLVFVGFAIPVR
jgi:cytochrome c biogenesis protein CcdA